MYDHYSAIVNTLEANHIKFDRISGNVAIYKEEKHLSYVEVAENATFEELGYAILAEHFRIMHLLETFPKYKPNGLRKMQAVWYWVSTGGNFEKHLVICELLEHCLANSTAFRGYDAFNFGGELAGYNDDVVYGAIEQGQRFMTFGDDFDRAALWAEAHEYSALSRRCIWLTIWTGKSPQPRRKAGLFCV